MQEPPIERQTVNELCQQRADDRVDAIATVSVSWAAPLF
jgi:hypothetical protein